MVNQIAIAGLVQALSEAVHLAKRAGLDVATVIDAISGCAAQSWQMNNRALTMADGEFDFGFAVKWMRKDLGLTLEEATSNGASSADRRVGKEWVSKSKARWATGS